MTTIRIRPATSADAATIVRFNAAMALETEGWALDEARLERGVRTLLAEPRRGLYLLAEVEGAVVGQLMITYEWSDWRSGDFWWIQSVFVEPAARRSGVFRALYREIESRARAEAGCCGLRLYVETENRRAHATYESLGMSRAHYHLYEIDFARRA